MPTCPNCLYKLVLLSNRRKYKCSLCSKVYPQKEIEGREFRIWNEQQRKIELVSIESKKRSELTKEEKLERAREYSRKWRANNKDLYNEIKRKYWNNKLEYLNSKRRERYKANRNYILNSRKRWEENNQHKHTMKKRLSDLREQQRQLALKRLKIKDYKLSSATIQKVLPTFVLSYLLLF